MNAQSIKSSPWVSWSGGIGARGLGGIPLSGGACACGMRKGGARRRKTARRHKKRRYNRTHKH